MKALLDLIVDIWDFMKVRKKYWLAPLIFTILLLGTVLVVNATAIVLRVIIRTRKKW